MVPWERLSVSLIWNKTFVSRQEKSFNSLQSHLSLFLLLSLFQQSCWLPPLPPDWESCSWPFSPSPWEQASAQSPARCTPWKLSWEQGAGSREHAELSDQPYIFPAPWTGSKGRWYRGREADTTCLARSFFSLFFCLKKISWKDKY